MFINFNQKVNFKRGERGENHITLRSRLKVPGVTPTLTPISLEIAVAYSTLQCIPNIIDSLTNVGTNIVIVWGDDP